MEVNLPDVVREVSAAFERYERALNDNDVASLNELFWDAPDTVRYGVTEELYGHAEVAGFRVARDPAGVRRQLLRVVITTFRVGLRVRRHME